MTEYAEYTGRRPMRTSSKIVLIICGALLVLLAAVYIPILSDTHPEFTEQDAHDMLNRLADAFVRKNTEAVLGFASPDVKAAGQNLEQLRDLLHRFFGTARNLEVQFRDMRYSRSGNTVTLDTQAVAGELPPGSKDFTETYYNRPVRFVVQRRSIPHLWGMLKTYEWKITEVDAEIPEVNQP